MANNDVHSDFGDTGWYWAKLLHFFFTHHAVDLVFFYPPFALPCVLETEPNLGRRIVDFARRLVS